MVSSELWSLQECFVLEFLKHSEDVDQCLAAMQIQVMQTDVNRGLECPRLMQLIQHIFIGDTQDQSYL